MFSETPCKQQESDVVLAAQMSPVSFYRSSSTDVRFMPCWLAPYFIFHFLPCQSSHMTSFSTLLLRIDSLGETNWWRIKQPAAESSPLVSHNATAPICVSFASSWEGADFKLKTVSKMAEGWGCDYDPWQSSSPHPHPPHSSVCYSQWLWKSAIVGLNGRQRQDAAIVGVEVLCVAPRSVAAAGCLAIVGAGLALPGHLLQEAGQAGTAALPMLVAAQGLHTAEGLRLGGW